MKNPYKLAALTLVVMPLVAGAAMAQQPPANPAARQAGAVQKETPQSTTATYGDWVVQCQAPPDAQAQNQKMCDMAQVTQLQGRNVPFSRVAIPRPVKGQAVKLIVQLPVNASFATNLRIQTGDADPGIAAPFARCIPGGCFADFDLKDDVLKKFRVSSGSGKLTFADASGHEVGVPISFNGFGQALDTLARE